MKPTALLSILSVALIGCSSNSQKHMAKTGSGREVDELDYIPFHQLEEEQKKKSQDEMEFKTVIASDGSRSFKCDESDVSKTVLAPAGYSPDALVLRSLGVHYDKSKTEIQCDIRMKLNLPITFHMISTNNDTVSSYLYTK